jgi:hypothetical protein
MTKKYTKKQIVKKTQRSWALKGRSIERSWALMSAPALSDTFAWKPYRYTQIQKIGTGSKDSANVFEIFNISKYSHHTDSRNCLSRLLQVHHGHAWQLGIWSVRVQSLIGLQTTTEFQPFAEQYFRPRIYLGTSRLTQKFSTTIVWNLKRVMIYMATHTNAVMLALDCLVTYL